MARARAVSVTIESDLKQKMQEFKSDEVIESDTESAFSQCTYKRKFPLSQKQYLKDNWAFIKTHLALYNIRVKIRFTKQYVGMSVIHPNGFNQGFNLRARYMLRMLTMNIPYHYTARVLEENIYVAFIYAKYMFFSDETYYKLRHRLLEPDSRTLTYTELFTNCNVLFDKKIIVLLGVRDGVKKAGKIVLDTLDGASHPIERLQKLKEIYVREDREPELDHGDWAEYLSNFPPSMLERRIRKSSYSSDDSSGDENGVHGEFEVNRDGGEELNEYSGDSEDINGYSSTGEYEINEDEDDDDDDNDDNANLVRVYKALTEVEVNGHKDNAVDKVNRHKDDVVIKVNGHKNNGVDKVNGHKDDVVVKVNGHKDNAVDKVNGHKDHAVDKVNGHDNDVAGKRSTREKQKGVNRYVPCETGKLGERRENNGFDYEGSIIYITSDDSSDDGCEDISDDEDDDNESNCSSSSRHTPPLPNDLLDEWLHSHYQNENRPHRHHRRHRRHRHSKKHKKDKKTKEKKKKHKKNKECKKKRKNHKRSK